MIIEGERASAASGETYQVKNPATGEVVDEVPNGGVEDVDRAARAAEKAQKSWGRLAPAERARILHAATTEVQFDNVPRGAHTVTVMLTGSNNISVTPPLPDQVAFTVG